MADSVPLIDAAIANRLGTVVYSYRTSEGTALYSGSVPVHNTVAPQQAPAPYLVFQLQTGVPDYWFNGREEEGFDYALKAMSLRTYASQEANPIFEQAATVLQDAPLSIPGYKLMKARRGSRIRYKDSKGYWNVGSLWRIEVVKE